MRARAFTGSVCIVSSALCAGCDYSEPGIYDPSVYDAPPVPSGPVVYDPGYGPLLGYGQLALSGSLDGELRGIALAGETTDNFGNYELREDGGASLYMSIAAAGEPTGAGMLLINLMDDDLLAKLEGGRWTSQTAGGEAQPYISVGSCAGPALGEWPYESGAVDYELEANEDPVQPGVVVLVVKAQFPRNDLDFTDTAELVGQLRFELPDESAAGNGSPQAAPDLQ